MAIWYILFAYLPPIPPFVHLHMHTQTHTCWTNAGGNVPYSWSESQTQASHYEALFSLKYPDTFSCSFSRAQTSGSVFWALCGWRLRSLLKPRNWCPWSWTRLATLIDTACSQHGGLQPQEHTQLSKVTRSQELMAGVSSETMEARGSEMKYSKCWKKIKCQSKNEDEIHSQTKTERMCC